MKLHEIRDPIYGFISINAWERDIINHRVFQRLRDIRQLALTNLVYPGAMHTRFEHSIGVMHLASLIYQRIVNKDSAILKELFSYNDEGLARDHALVRLAALLHDVGHAPFSHASEEVMPINNSTGLHLSHEDYSSAMIKNDLIDIIENHPVNKSNYNITANEVAGLIQGDPTALGKRLFWRVLLSSQLDADRGDYLLRDSLHAGVKYGVYDQARLIIAMALSRDPETGDIILGIDDDSWHVAESLVVARYLMFTQVYFHKTRRAYDYHLLEIIKNYLKDNKYNSTYPGLDKLREYIAIDDIDILKYIKEHTGDEHCAAVLNRKHIRSVYSTSERPDISEEVGVAKFVEKLNNKGIWCYEDLSDKTWYKLKKDRQENNEIMIIDEKKQANPLSSQLYSRLVKNIGDQKKIRVYVKPEDKNSATAEI